MSLSMDGPRKNFEAGNPRLIQISFAAGGDQFSRLNTCPGNTRGQGAGLVIPGHERLSRTLIQPVPQILFHFIPLNSRLCA